MAISGRVRAPARVRRFRGAGHAAALMRPSALLYVYRRRLRVQAPQELLAGLGVAVAVALVFATLVANSSIAGSASDVVHAVVGPARLQLRARGQEGFDESLLHRVEHLPGVRQAAPLLEQTALISGSSGRRITVDLAGADVSFTILNGLAHTLPVATLAPQGLGLSKASAQGLGITPEAVRTGEASQVSLKLRGSSYPLNVTAVLGAEAVGVLSQARVAVMSLRRLQQLAGLRGRISRILVEPQAGRDALVRSELETVAAGQITVAPADRDIALLRQALRPGDQASGAFATIAALLGFLFAFNAVLLMAPERRRAIAEMRLSGTRRAAIGQMVIFQAVCLGLASSLLGLLIGYALAVSAFHQSPGYLSQVFVLGGGTVVGLGPIALALVGGVLVTCLASLVLLVDLRRGRALDAVYFEEGAPGNALGKRVQRPLFAAALGLVAAASILFALVPSMAIIACLLLALATVLAVPVVFAGLLRLAGALAVRDQKLTILPVALKALRTTTLRSLALAATSAVALFGAVALGGARDDLLRGIGGSARGYAADASIWVVSPGDNQATVSFLPGNLARLIAQAPGVAGVRTFLGGFDELGDRRVWVIARPPGTGLPQLKNQVVDGNATVAVSRLGEGGWIVVPQQIAEEHHVRVGQWLALPTPAGSVAFRIAATTTNLGWPTGVIVMNTADYARAWRTSAPTALGVVLKPGVKLSQGLSTIGRYLGPGSGLEAVPAPVRAARIETSSSEGTSQLAEISTLLVIAAILAMSAALGSAIWQRRPSLASLRLAGAPPGRLRQVLFTEAALTLSAGCATGLVAGIYGQVVIDRYLKHVTGFPVASLGASWRPLEILAVVVAAVLALVAVPAWFAARVPLALALQDE